MLDPLFREAFCHAKDGHTVLGRLLHPLCAFDLLTLEAINSPFLLDGGTAEVSDLLIAVWILSNPVPEDLTIGNLELSAAGQEWVKSLVNKIDMPRDCEAIQSYIADYYSPPEIMADVAKNPITDLGAPWMLSAVIGVVAKLHLPLYRAWTMGIGQLLWYRASISEMETDLRIVSDNLRGDMRTASKGPTFFKMEPGETLADFSKRTGIPEQHAAMLLHNGGK